MGKRKIGIDLGTTNTTVAYYDEENNRLERYEFDNKTYIPSAIAYHKVKGTIKIGRQAKTYAKSADYYYYEYYKIDILNNYNGVKYSQHEKTYLEIALDYLHTLIRRYKEENRIEQGLLDSIVLSVPNSVLLDKGPKSLYEQFNRFLKSEARSYQLVSEPECACAFFYNNYCKSKNDMFQGGYVSVFDYGGGTLDASMCKLNYEESDGEIRPSIRIVREYADNSDLRRFGGAGVAFVTELTKRVTI